MKARAALYAASPLFNTNNDVELWHRAAMANKELIDNCEAAKMKLIDDYSALWSASSYSDALDELIFGRRATRTTNSFEGYNFPIGLENCKGGNCPTQTLVDAYEMQATGLRPDETVDYDSSQPYYEGRDPRFYLLLLPRMEMKMAELEYYSFADLSGRRERRTFEWRYTDKLLFEEILSDGCRFTF